MPEPQLRVTRNDDERRYEIHVDDVLGGYTVFHEREPGVLRFPHTVIDPAFRGKGLAVVLVERAMADVATRGEIVVPLCTVVHGYLDTHDVPGLAVQWPAETV
ncbi:hypothetical protein GCM10022240_00810 [Microbacterium kribbense]|uniref:N-acetyltransferase domain-containing protein n=1 Tax=Microbacterium kribbense TaxID=433645 RepID=A0ABP7G4R4_9MICO